MGARAGLILVLTLISAAAGCSSKGTKTVTVTTTATSTVTATTTVTSTVTATPSVDTTAFSAFRGPWTGHTRGLTVTPSGLATEYIGDGCCTPQIDLTLQLKNPTGTVTAARADAVVVAVRVFPGYPASAPKPAVGDVGLVTVKDGVFEDSWLHVTFCDDAQSRKGTCGA
ncbi:MAG: hypothetical protein DLM58_09185 [Pseudonocardiales bacterium]|nr:MAG: hypothetical protein DLM58_09185 [Pseudonocardiales bacterium]